MGSIKMPLVHQVKLQYYELLWRMKNRNNRTHVGTIFDFNTVQVGLGTYGTLNIEQASSNAGVVLGNYCSIANDVTFIVGNDHYIDRISSYPFKTMEGHAGFDVRSKGGIEVKDDVWIGYGATILDGVTINQGAVIGAKAVVTKDVPPYAVVVGSPARVIRYRFEDSIIKELCRHRFDSIHLPLSETQAQSAYHRLTSNNIMNVCKDFFIKS